LSGFSNVGKNYNFTENLDDTDKKNKNTKRKNFNSHRPLTPHKKINKEYEDYQVRNKSLENSKIDINLNRKIFVKKQRIKKEEQDSQNFFDDFSER